MLARFFASLPHLVQCSAASKGPFRIDGSFLWWLSMRISVTNFELVCPIEPERNTDGTIKEFLPQSRYPNRKNLLLNKYGNGPFCKFKIPSTIKSCGVYAIMVDGTLKYIGECTNLSSRYNAGYGNISPRNCYIGGQETNCRINNLIFRAISEGESTILWFHATAEYKKLETELRASERPKWNLV